MSPPAAGLSGWEWILQEEGLPATPPKVAYLDVDGEFTPASYIAAAKAQGSKTICYISVGTAETYRADDSQFVALGVVGKKFPGFPEDRYLNVNRYADFIHLMDARLRNCRSKGFDYVEFDNMDLYSEAASTTGFPQVPQATQIAYVTELARRTNGYGMLAVQKNAGDLSTRLQPLFGAILFEECVRLNFCSQAKPYVDAGKPAFNAEYPESWLGAAYSKAAVCAASRAAGVLTIIARLDLDRVTDPC